MIIGSMTTHVDNQNIMQGFHVLLIRVFGHTFDKAREHTSDLLVRGGGGGGGGGPRGVQQ
jgi:hypothetical protein